MNARDFAKWNDRVQNAVLSPSVSDDEVNRMIETLRNIEPDDAEAQRMKQNVLGAIEGTMEIRDPEHMR